MADERSPLIQSTTRRVVLAGGVFELPAHPSLADDPGMALLTALALEVEALRGLLGPLVLLADRLTPGWELTETDEQTKQALAIVRGHAQAVRAAQAGGEKENPAS